MRMEVVRVFVLCGLLSLGGAATPYRLPKLHNGGDGHGLTLSGFSSGGNLAQQLQFSFPHLFRGVAVFSHTYYRCGPGDGKVLTFDRSCTLLGNGTAADRYNHQLALQDIEDYANSGLIGNPKCLRNKRLYINVPLRSFVYTPEMTLNILKIYERYIQNPKAIRTRVEDAPLVLPTSNNYGPPCSEESSDKYAFLGNCGFSGAFDALNFLVPERVVNEPPPGDSKVELEPLYEFNQEEFTRGIENNHMDKIGYFYVPRACHQNTQKCIVHFYFHGCRTNREHQGSKHIENSGYLEVGELNNIIMIFPQAAASLPENRSGCFDSFGIGGPLYATRQGAQVRSVRRMIERVIGSNAWQDFQSQNCVDNEKNLGASQLPNLFDFFRQSFYYK